MWEPCIVLLVNQGIDYPLKVTVHVYVNLDISHLVEPVVYQLARTNSMKTTQILFAPDVTKNVISVPVHLNQNAANVCQAIIFMDLLAKQIVQIIPATGRIPQPNFANNV